MATAQVSEFKRRVPELLKIEGWYELEDGTRVKISCRYNDILRCSSFPQPESPFNERITRELNISKRYRLLARERNWRNKFKRPKHFTSCYAEGGAHDVQPLRRCVYSDNCAIIYLPDSHGNFLARCFLWAKERTKVEAVWNKDPVNPTWEPVYSKEKYYEIDKIYGNGLNPQSILNLFKLMGKDCRYNPDDTYVERW